TLSGAGTGDASGDIYVVADRGGSIRLGGPLTNLHAYAIIGHGSSSSPVGDLSGGVSLFADGDIVATDPAARIGHFQSGSAVKINMTSPSAAGYQIVANGTT